MAAYSHRRAASGTSLLNGSGLGEQELPGGSCNYRDPLVGTRTSSCGCQRFWLNVTSSNSQDVGPERAWCFCGHHACFHSAFSQRQNEQEQGIGSSRAGNNIGEQRQAVTDRAVQNAPAEQASSTSSKPLAGLGIRSGSQSQSQSINTRVWQALNDFARNQEADGTSGASSKLPSTAVPSVADEVRVSPGPITQERLRQYRPMAPPVHIPPGPALQRAEEYSATEVATPSVAGTPDFRALATSSQARVPPGHLTAGATPARNPTAGHLERNVQNNDAPAVRTQGPSPSSEDRPVSMHDIQSLIRVYGHRLETLESLSFSHVPVEEFHERLELFDGRMLDLEQWRRDREQADLPSPPLQPSGSKRRRVQLPSEAGSFGSNPSFDSAAAAQAEVAVLATLAANAETHPRIDALESRVAGLEEASRPSFARPWQVQVVLLPWNRELRGIWFSSMEATQHSLQSNTQLVDEWHGVESTPKLSFKDSASGAWTTESIEAWANEAKEWLSPKACGPNGTVFQRLASRGFVQDITLTSSGAHYILDKLNTAFGQLEVESIEHDDVSPPAYQALREHFIPLRKVPKSARLRFLSPAEMVTSATWTSTFLESSVLMKVNDGQRRLYMTTPEAYLQPHHAGWSWNRIRQLPMYNATAEEHAIRSRGSAVEACWTFNERLDHQPSLQSSFASHASQWSTRSHLPHPDDKDIHRPPISPQSELRSTRQRTVSLPSSTSATGNLMDVAPKRRVASFEPATLRRSSELSDAAATSKRRRISVSPEAERHGVNFTPRWSREPPSPFTSEAALEARSQTTGMRKRAATPSAYATPYSNSTFAGRMDFVGGDGDTEAATDIIGEQSERGEEEWQGVEDGGTNLEDDKIEAKARDMDEDDVDDEPDDI